MSFGQLPAQPVFLIGGEGLYLVNRSCEEEVMERKTRIYVERRSEEKRRKPMKRRKVKYWA